MGNASPGNISPGNAAKGAVNRPPEADDPRVYLAAERTLLAWIRTGLALMGFGFIVARFGLFLRQLAMVDHTPPLQGTGLSLWIGVALVLLGVFMTAWAAINHYRWVSRLQAGILERPRAFSLAVGVAGVLVLIGLIIAAGLLLRVPH